MHLVRFAEQLTPYGPRTRVYLNDPDDIGKAREGITSHRNELYGNGLQSNAMHDDIGTAW